MRPPGGEDMRARVGLFVFMWLFVGCAFLGEASAAGGRPCTMGGEPWSTDSTSA
jgi:hypothetical protein